MPVDSREELFEERSPNWESVLLTVSFPPHSMKLGLRAAWDEVTFYVGSMYQWP